MDNTDIVIDIVNKSSVMKVGKVTSVEGRTVKVLVDHEKNASHLFYKGKLIKSIVVGGYVKITKGFDRLVGKIEGEFVDEDLFQSRKHYTSDTAKIKRVLTIKMLGYFDDYSFERGIKELPLIDNECFLLDKAEFDKVHHFVKKGDTAIEVGSLSQENGMPIKLGIDGLFASHIGIFGNTGSGKSYTLASLYHALFKEYKDKVGFKANARFFLIDFNGEYVSDIAPDRVITEPKYKKTYKLSTYSQEGGEKFPMPEKAINDPLIWIILLEATEKTQQPFIKRALENKNIENQFESANTYKNFIKQIIFDITKNKDKNLEKAVVIKFLKDLRDCSSKFSGFNETIRLFYPLEYHGTNYGYYFARDGGGRLYSDNEGFDDEINRGIESISTPVETINVIEKIRLKIVSSYYDEIIRGYSNREHISPLISRLKARVPDLVKVIETREPNVTDEKNLTVVSMKDINIHMRKILPLIFCKYLYEKKKRENKKNDFLNIIIDEAHNVLSDSSQRESEQWKDYRLETFEEIIKEGRKFGAFLTISSQRPSDISTTILSQLHNYFLHRLISEKDINAIERTVSYLDKVSNEFLSIMPTGTCILAGLVAQVPVIIDINPITKGYEPSSQTIKPTDHW